MNLVAPPPRVAGTGAQEPTCELVACPTCHSDRTVLFHEIDDVPSNSCILFATREEAVGCQRGSVGLRFCEDCGFIYNARFRQDLTEYSGRYEETQGFSPTFSRFHRNLARELVERHDLRGRRVMEIGCGKGEFLVLLSQLGENEGTGIDPSALPERLEGVEGAGRVTLVPEYFNPSHCAQPPDFLCCKMTLEHITHTADFIAEIRAGLDPAEPTVVFFQVPEAERIIRHCAFEDIYHEHCSYFTPASLRFLFERCGFRVTRTAIEYDDQYLTIEAIPAQRDAAASLPDTRELARLVGSFPGRLAEHEARWRRRVEEARAEGRTVTLWGSGSKAVSFLTTLGIGEAIDCVTDINPNRHGHYMPGTGHPIIAPRDLVQVDPGLVIVMNRIYEDEIRADLAELGLDPVLECL